MKAAELYGQEVKLTNFSDFIFNLGQKLKVIEIPVAKALHTQDNLTILLYWMSWRISVVFYPPSNIFTTFILYLQTLRFKLNLNFFMLYDGCLLCLVIILIFIPVVLTSTAVISSTTFSVEIILA